MLPTFRVGGAGTAEAEGGGVGAVGAVGNEADCSVRIAVATRNSARMPI